MERNRAIIEAMIHASIDRPELIDELVEMAYEPDAEDDLNADTAPVDPAAKQRLAAWLRKVSRPK